MSAGGSQTEELTGAADNSLSSDVGSGDLPRVSPPSLPPPPEGHDPVDSGEGCGAVKPDDGNGAGGNGLYRCSGAVPHIGSLNFALIPKLDIHIRR